jgi:hypothetical protein
MSHLLTVMLLEPLAKCTMHTGNIQRSAGSRTVCALNSIGCIGVQQEQDILVYLPDPHTAQGVPTKPANRTTVQTQEPHVWTNRKK